MFINEYLVVIFLNLGSLNRHESVSVSVSTTCMSQTTYVEQTAMMAGGGNTHNLIKFNLEKKTAYDKKETTVRSCFGKAVKEAWNFSVGE